MVIISNKKRNKRMTNVSSANPLPEQKHIIAVSATNYFGLSIMLFIVAIIVICVVLSEKELMTRSAFVLLTVLFPVFFLIYAIAFIRRLYIWWKYRKISFSNEQSVRLNCCKVRFLLHPISKYSSAILGMILKDENNHKFYYVYPESEMISDYFKKDIKKQYTGDIEVTCYRNTNIIKRLPPLN